VQSFLDGLNVGTNAGTTPQSRLAAAQAQYEADLAGARAGDADAYANLTRSAQAYINAGSEVFGSGGGQTAIIGAIQGALGGLDAVTQIDANIEALHAIEAAINAGTGATTSGGANTVSAIAAIPFAITEANLLLLNSLGTSFAQLDTDLSGNLTIEEFAAGMSGKATDAAIDALFELTDTNHDGVVSLREANNAAAAGFTSALDTLRDSVTTGAYAPMTAEEFAANFAGAANDETLNEWFGKLDTNADGTLTAMEVVSDNTNSTNLSIQQTTEAVRILTAELIDMKATLARLLERQNSAIELQTNTLDAAIEESADDQVYAITTTAELRLRA
jgi:Ca2+-binding EF-hand superfamily protein